MGCTGEVPYLRGKISTRGSFRIRYLLLGLYRSSLPGTPVSPSPPYTPQKKSSGIVCLNYSENPYLRNSCILIMPVIVGISTFLAVLWVISLDYAYSVILLYAVNIQCLFIFRGISSGYSDTFIRLAVWLFVYWSL